MNIEKQIVTDIFEVVRSQHKVISYLVANDQGLVETLANDPALSYFADSFRNHQSYALANPKGQLAEALDAMQHTLDAIGARLKQDMGGWDN